MSDTACDTIEQANKVRWVTLLERLVQKNQDKGWRGLQPEEREAGVSVSVGILG